MPNNWCLTAGTRLYRLWHCSQQCVRASSSMKTPHWWRRSSLAAFWWWMRLTKRPRTSPAFWRPWWSLERCTWLMADALCQVTKLRHITCIQKMLVSLQTVSSGNCVSWKVLPVVWGLWCSQEGFSLQTALSGYCGDEDMFSVSEEWQNWKWCTLRMCHIR